MLRCDNPGTLFPSRVRQDPLMLMMPGILGLGLGHWAGPRCSAQMCHSPASSLPQFPCYQRPQSILGDVLPGSFHRSASLLQPALTQAPWQVGNSCIFWLFWQHPYTPAGWFFLPHGLNARFRNSEGFVLAKLELKCVLSRQPFSTRQPHKGNFHCRQKLSCLWHCKSSSEVIHR